jgi:hypothetical protein
MDWITLGAAFLGGGFGGAIPATVSLVQLRRDKTAALQARRWLDAETVADAKKLLIDLDPHRRTINAQAPDVEAELWKGLNERKDRHDRELLLLGTGHTSQEVSAAANELDLALVWLAHWSELAVRAVVAHRDFLDLVEDAVKCREAAAIAVNKLADAVKEAAAPKRRLFRFAPQAKLEARPPRIQNSSEPAGHQYQE